MLIYTKNSVYEVVLRNGCYEITKSKELNPSTYIPLYGKRYSYHMHCVVGERCYFDTWATSTVQKVEGEL